MEKADTISAVRSLTVKVSKEMGKRIDQKRIDDDITLQDAATELLRMWLDGEIALKGYEKEVLKIDNMVKHNNSVTENTPTAEANTIESGHTDNEHEQEIRRYIDHAETAIHELQQGFAGIVAKLDRTSGGIHPSPKPPGGLGKGTGRPPGKRRAR